MEKSVYKREPITFKSCPNSGDGMPKDKVVAILSEIKERDKKIEEKLRFMLLQSGTLMSDANKVILREILDTLA